MTTPKPTFAHRHDYATAYRALSAILADPDDTKQAFRVVEALGGPAAERLYQRFEASEVGRATLGEKRDLLSPLRDTARLEAMPEGSLGRAYLQFLRSQQLTAAGLVSASEQGDLHAAPLDADRQRFKDRLRDSHDLWHVVAGYRGDLIGEASILALSYAQTHSPGVALISVLGLLKLGPLPGARKTIVGAYLRGRRAAWLPGVEWEAKLARPLTEVRAELGLSDPPSYEPVYSQDPRLAEPAMA